MYIMYVYTGPIRSICCWTDIISVRLNFNLHQNDQALAKFDRTFNNVDLTNVRCQTVKIGPVYVHVNV